MNSRQFLQTWDVLKGLYNFGGFSQGHGNSALLLLENNSQKYLQILSVTTLFTASLIINDCQLKIILWVLKLAQTNIVFELIIQEFLLPNEV